MQIHFERVCWSCYWKWKEYLNEAKTYLPLRIFTGLPGLSKRKGESSQESRQQFYVDRKSEEKTSKVFEFETTISVSLDSGGYLMTIILISQLLVFGMFLYSRTVTDQKAEQEN